MVTGNVHVCNVDLVVGTYILCTLFFFCYKSPLYPIHLFPSAFLPPDLGYPFGLGEHEHAARWANGMCGMMTVVGDGNDVARYVDMACMWFLSSFYRADFAYRAGMNIYEHIWQLK